MTFANDPTCCGRPMFKPETRYRHECLACGHTILPSQLFVTRSSILRDTPGGILLDTDGNPWTPQRVVLQSIESIKQELQSIREEYDLR